MSLASFLGNIGDILNPAASPASGLPMPGPISGYGGGTFDTNGRQVTPLDRFLSPVAQQTPSPQESSPQPAPRKKPGGVMNFLGMLGDALLVGNGAEPIYERTMQRRAIGDNLTRYLGITDPNLAAIIQDDPQTGYAIWKARQPGQGEAFTLGAGQVRYGPNGEVIAKGPDSASTDGPTFVRELQSLGIDPHSPEALELYYARNSPAGYLLKPGGRPATPAPSGPQPGTVVGGYRFKGGNPNDRNAWEAVGGGVSNGTGGFPGN